MTWIGWSHNPEVAGSNPAPATAKGPAKRGLLFSFVTRAAELCTHFCTHFRFKSFDFRRFGTHCRLQTGQLTGVLNNPRQEGAGRSSIGRRSFEFDAEDGS